MQHAGSWRYRRSTDAKHAHADTHRRIQRHHHHQQQQHSITISFLTSESKSANRTTFLPGIDPSADNQCSYISTVRAMRDATRTYCDRYRIPITHAGVSRLASSTWRYTFRRNALSAITPKDALCNFNP